MPSPGTPGAGRRLLSAGLLLLSFAAALEIHSGAEVLGAPAWREHSFQATCPPGLATHVEAARPAAHPDCPACLLRLDSRGAHLLAPAGLTPRLPAREVLADAVPARLPRSTSAPSSRGPPAA
jgi:hypothetical protein